VTNRKRVIAIASCMDMQFTISAVLISLPIWSRLCRAKPAGPGEPVYGKLDDGLAGALQAGGRNSP
jgi:hypothetical protein